MGFKIGDNDTPLVARLKLLYLIPISIVCCIPLMLAVGFIEHTIPSIRTIVSVLRTGRP
jgi:hypothetical protein